MSPQDRGVMETSPGEAYMVSVLKLRTSRSARPTQGWETTLLSKRKASLLPSAGFTTSNVETHRESIPFPRATLPFPSIEFPTWRGGHFLPRMHLTLVFNLCSVPINTRTGCRRTCVAFATICLFGAISRQVARKCTVALVVTTLTALRFLARVPTTIRALL